MPREFAFNGASVPQKEVECSGEAARDMANDNAIVSENGNSVSVFFISGAAGGLQLEHVVTIRGRQQ